MTLSILEIIIAKCLIWASVVIIAAILIATVIEAISKICKRIEKLIHHK